MAEFFLATSALLSDDASYVAEEVGEEVESHEACLRMCAGGETCADMGMALLVWPCERKGGKLQYAHLTRKFSRYSMTP